MIIIGEKINATLRRARTIIQNRDERGLLQLAKDQAGAGADFVDVNVGTGKGTQEDEIQAMRWAVETIQKSARSIGNHSGPRSMANAPSPTPSRTAQ